MMIGYEGNGGCASAFYTSKHWTGNVWVLMDTHRKDTVNLECTEESGVIKMSKERRGEMRSTDEVSKS